MKSSPNTIEILLVDFRPQEDLMFWDAFSRSIANAHREGRWMCLIVGCNEKIERVLLQNGLETVRSAEDQLVFPSEISAEVEKLVREEKKNISSRLTDEGVAAVGIMGFERGLFRSIEGEIVAKVAITSSLWQASSVVPVVMSICMTEAGVLRDVHPINMARAMVKSMTEKVHISVLSQRVTGRISALDSKEGREQLHDLEKKNWISKLIENAPDLSNWSVSGPSVPNHL